MFTGLIDLPWWGYVVVALVFTHITIAAVTIYLHRHSAHRALELSPVVSHFFRFWLWLTTGMVTKQWTAIHRKHHAKCETAEDPHSPQFFGIKKVLFEGAELYRAESKVGETMEKYGHGTPDDWVERNIYSKHSGLGIKLMFIADLLLFGPIGITIWAVQMIWIPLFAAGVINGIGHFWGYRNFHCEDTSTNVLPWGILIGGEELHNNHHAYGSSAKLSSKWYEFDIGWMYIRILEMLGLAKVKKMAPKIKWDTSKSKIDMDTLQAIITHRYDVMTKFGRSVKTVWHSELSKLGSSAQANALRRWLHLDERNLKEQEMTELKKALGENSQLAKIYQLRQDLSALWERSSLSKEQLLSNLQEWVKKAEASNISPLADFARSLKCYA